MNPTPTEAPEPVLSPKAPKPTKAQLRQAVLKQLKKTGLNRHGRRALMAQVKRKIRK